ncbi:MAG: hypothetical protein K0R94_1040, partial [Burkholderiales bacterium]|nr:hypothetical protein [Burkholderiales bacterium]
MDNVHLAKKAGVGNINRNIKKMELAKTYIPGEIETKWYEEWENNGYFKPNFDKKA